MRFENTLQKFGSEPDRCPSRRSPSVWPDCRRRPYAPAECISPSKPVDNESTTRFVRLWILTANILCIRKKHSDQFFLFFLKVKKKLPLSYINPTSQNSTHKSTHRKMAHLFKRKRRHALFLSIQVFSADRVLRSLVSTIYSHLWTKTLAHTQFLSFHKLSLLNVISIISEQNR